MDEKINVTELERGNEGSKASLVLSIIGTVFLVIAGIICYEFLSLVIPFITGAEDFSSALGLILGLIYFLLPGIITSIVSSILNGLAWKKSSIGKGRIYKLITFILSLVVLLTFVGTFIYLLII